MEFGFTNDRARFDEVVAFRNAAVADGWEIEPTYRIEPAERAARLRRDGFSMQILSRDDSDKKNKWKFEAQISIWGPDSLAVRPPKSYDWEAIKAGVRKCNHCGDEDVDTQRYSFAGRCCAKCRPEMKKQHEQPGWCD